MPRNSLVGFELPGGYSVIRALAAGPKATVYLAEQHALGREVVLKILHQHLADDPEANRRFMALARAAGRLRHPHSVRVYDFGEHRGRLFMVMERCEGQPLTEILDEQPLMEPRRVLTLSTQILGALGEAHEWNLVHRALRPSNVLVARPRGGMVFSKVIDFGLARVFTSSRRSGALAAGNMDYVSPELERGEDVDSRSDLYSFGVLLFRMVTGRMPFPARGAVGVQGMRAPIPDAARVAPSRVTQDMREILRIALREDPGARFQSAEGFAMALSAAGQEWLAALDASSSCGHCGAPMRAAARFCGQCGARS